jgi:hypothetical protein
METSKELKKKLAQHLYWRLHYTVVCDEFNFIDIVGVKRSEYVAEFEIKVTKADFDREIRHIMADEKTANHYGRDWEKISKHKTYLTGSRPKTNYDLRYETFGVTSSLPFIPNEFYFYVPEFLAEYATKKVVELKLPYGVIKTGRYILSNGNLFPSDYIVLKKAKKLHERKAESLLYYELAHALTIRGRLLQ